MFVNRSILGPKFGFLENQRSGDFMIATGGIITTSGRFKIHTLTASGDFEILKLGSGIVKRLLCAAGGGGGVSAFGAFGGGGGSAGEYNYNPAYVFSALGIYPFVCGVPGIGATVVNTDGTNATNSSFDGITVIGGGYGAGVFDTPGGSGAYGGGGASAGASGLGGNGLIAFKGGKAATAQAGAGGGGGAGGNGSDCAAAQAIGAAPGPGILCDITGASLEYCAGGWGGGNGTGQHPAAPAFYGCGGDGTALTPNGPAMNGGGSILIIAYQYR